MTGQGVGLQTEAVKNPLFWLHYEGSQAPEQVVHRCRGVTTIGDVHGPGQPDLAEPALSRAWDWMIFRGAFQTQLLCDSQVSCSFILCMIHFSCLIYVQKTWHPFWTLHFYSVLFILVSRLSSIASCFCSSLFSFKILVSVWRCACKFWEITCFRHFFYNKLNTSFFYYNRKKGITISRFLFF